MRFLFASLLAAAFALPALAQSGPRVGGGFGGRGGPQESTAEIDKLKEQIKNLEAKLKLLAEEKAKPKKDDKPEPKKDEFKKPEPPKDIFKKPEAPKEEAKKPEGPESRRGPMGGGMGGFGFGGPGMGGFGVGSFPIEKLTPEEQATFKKLLAKMSPPKPQATGSTTSTGGSNIEARLDRLEKMVQELVRRNADQPRLPERGEQRRPEGERRPEGDREPRR